jgi:hypothetical protein
VDTDTFITYFFVIARLDGPDESTTRRWRRPVHHHVNRSKRDISAQCSVLFCFFNSFVYPPQVASRWVDIHKLFNASIRACVFVRAPIHFSPVARRERRESSLCDVYDYKPSILKTI